MINHANIIYMPTISEIGGIETYVYEMVKKYSYLDIAVVSKSCDPTQAKRIRKYCKLYIYNGQEINCKVAIINYDQSIIDHICKSAKIYQTIHADYSQPIYQNKPQDHPRVTAFIAITDILKDKMKDILHTDKIIMSYNPLTIEDINRPLIIVSATRLHEHKGKGRILALTDAMDRLGINYIWFIITNEPRCIFNPKVVFVPNRLDIGPWLAMADYVALLSDSEACSYTLNEALYHNIPILCTPLPYLEEIGVKDGKNAYIVDFDCTNVDEVAKKITKIPKFTFKKLKDKYDEIFDNTKSTYAEERKKPVKVMCVNSYHDVLLNEYIPFGKEFEISWDRAEHLEEINKVRII